MPTFFQTLRLIAFFCFAIAMAVFTDVAGAIQLPPELQALIDKKKAAIAAGETPIQRASEADLAAAIEIAISRQDDLLSVLSARELKTAAKLGAAHWEDCSAAFEIYGQLEGSMVSQQQPKTQHQTRINMIYAALYRNAQRVVSTSKKYKKNPDPKFQAALQKTRDEPSSDDMALFISAYGLKCNAERVKLGASGNAGEAVATLISDPYKKALAHLEVSK